MQLSEQEISLMLSDALRLKDITAARDHCYLRLGKLEQAVSYRCIQGCVHSGQQW